MAKVCMVERDKKRTKMVASRKEAYAAWRTKMKDLRKRRAKGEDVSYEETMAVQFERQKKPRNVSPSRIRNRCSQTGRPRGFYRKFGISRNVLRELGSQGFIPGLKKSSW